MFVHLKNIIYLVVSRIKPSVYLVVNVVAKSFLTKSYGLNLLLVGCIQISRIKCIDRRIYIK